MKPVIAIGPTMPGWGSWEWLGEDLIQALAEKFTFTKFGYQEPIPKCDLALVIKHPLARDQAERVSKTTPLIYCPVDYYGAMNEVDSDFQALRCCSTIVIHSERLRKCFLPYAPVEHIDHHLKYLSLRHEQQGHDEFIVWIGVRSNLPYLSEWLRHHNLPAPLVVLTNVDPQSDVLDPQRHGLDPEKIQRIECWTPKRHRELVAQARAAFDIKGREFRQWHKPPAKAFDFLASGLPLAMNNDSSAADELLTRFDFQLCSPDDPERWFSEDYQVECQRIGEKLRLDLGTERVAARWESLFLANLKPPSNHVGQSSLESSQEKEAASTRSKSIRVAIVSMLFNWPTFGGGNIHTYDLARFLEKSGYDVAHFYVQYVPWAIGEVTEELPYKNVPLRFDENNWNPTILRQRVREAIEEYSPDYVIITDSWNSKAVLADAVKDFPYLMRMQALECLCPLNNIRLLPPKNGTFEQCGRHQLATPEDCRRCLIENQASSGPLHSVERSFCGVGSPEYHKLLMRSFAEAEAILVVNSLTEAMVSPHARKVVVAPSGMDPDRFAHLPSDRARKNDRELLCIAFAGRPDEPIKGFEVLRQACEILWQYRRDFELVVTSEPTNIKEPFLRFVGWQSQETLPQVLRDADICVVPSIAQEALGRTAVEAQAVGRPVVASRIGGLPTTIADGATGLLFESGNPEDLACQLETLMNDAAMRDRLGEAGRSRFEKLFSWNSVIDRCYRPLLCRQRAFPKEEAS